MDIPRRPETHVPIDDSWKLGDDGIDEDGHYDETRDRTFLKRLKREYPEAYKELVKILRKNNPDYESDEKQM
ncbi:hypothetical protein NsoK4_03515 [Nitrosopumilus sp. K4]|uniref:hypothetical protein n=1 Tax=Nitrosopumilus sp. K4 TaxID=2795383 RepID=UPI001BA97920|nr:hypothetical protein [Nitrosopumilus sp. K4]QUC65326.1 hypothetical protein NsoK4_03515 [Nitrosopumilus sp. K4]